MGDTTAAVNEHAHLLSSLMPATTWCVDTIADDSQRLGIKGWAIVPDYDRTRVSFAVNGIPFDEIVYPFRREDLARIFWYAPHGGDCGYHCSTQIPRQSVFANGFATFSLLDTRTGEPFDERHNYYYLDSLADTLPLPEKERRVRVHGGDDEFGFRIEGYSHYTKLQLVLRRILGRGYDSFRRILDWGCGCGRLSRYFTGLRPGALVGMDVDADNVGWCQANIPFGEFVHIPLRPPTQFADGSFDLLIGISIFTHLAEVEQNLWLTELYRLATDHAVLLMSVHGNSAACRQMWDLNLLRYWLRQGFVAGPNASLDAVLGEEGYYKNAAHTESYLLGNWSKFFDILEIIPGCIGNLQDLVVMRKRGR